MTLLFQADGTRLRRSAGFFGGLVKTRSEDSAPEADACSSTTVPHDSDDIPDDAVMRSIR